MLKVKLPATGQGFVLLKMPRSADRSEMNRLLDTVPVISLLPGPLPKCMMICDGPRFLDDMALVALPDTSKFPLNDERTPPIVNFAINEPVRSSLRLRNPELAAAGALVCMARPLYFPAGNALRRNTTPERPMRSEERRVGKGVDLGGR